MTRKTHLPFLIIATFSFSATVVSLLLKGELESIFEMIKVVLPIIVGITAVFLATRKFRVNV